MIHLVGPVVLAVALIGLGIMGVLTRRHPVMVLIAIELILAGGLVLLVTSGLVGGSRWSGASVLPLFVITIAAAETVVALAIVLTLHREPHALRQELLDGGLQHDGQASAFDHLIEASPVAWLDAPEAVSAIAQGDRRASDLG